MDTEGIVVRLQQQKDYRFEVSFGSGSEGGPPPILADEPPPLGQSAGPSPVQLLAAAVGNCLCDSLLFALRKFKQSPEPISGEVVATTGRNAQGRLRVVRLQAVLRLGVAASDLEHLDRVLGQFEEFCTVTQSVAPAIPVQVHVEDALGTRLK